MCTELDRLAATDMATVDDRSLRDQLAELAVAANHCYAQTLRRVDAFDQRSLAPADGFRTTRSWLVAALGVTPTTASRLVKAARLLRQLPKLTAALHTGQVSPEHVHQVVRLADHVDPARLVEIDATLADAAQVLDVSGFGQVCQRAQAHLDPDGADPAADFARRGVTLSPVGAMTSIRGQLDPEGAAAVQSALDALMPPPAVDDCRSAAQRRADALVELARLPLAEGVLPAVGGQRPQVGVMVWPQALSPETLAALAQAQADGLAAARLRELAGITDPNPGPGRQTSTTAGTTAGTTSPGTTSPGTTSPGTTSPGGTSPATGSAGTGSGGTGSAGTAGDWDGAPDRPQPGVLAPLWNTAGWADPSHLSWVGPIPPQVAQRIACDADIWRVILDPATSMPLDVGRAHRLVPYWIRKALYARDRGCRWPGCQALAPWCDAHHRIPWADGGHTSVMDCILLCRYHHMQVHEGGWSIDLDHHTGQVSITKPGGIPYLPPRSRSPAWTSPTTAIAPPQP